MREWNRDAPNLVTAFKIGGSVLEMPDLAARLRTILLQRAGSRPLLMVGGGGAADLVRRWDAIHRLDHATAHWLAVRAMALNERLVESLLAESIVVTNRADAAAAWNSGRLPILHCVQFLRAEEANLSDDAVLPRAWNATSDSIAAWVAGRWPAEELVLVKSCDPPCSSSGHSVDPLFATTAAGLRRISWVNLRSDSPMICDWNPHRWDARYTETESSQLAGALRSVESRK